MEATLRTQEPKSICRVGYLFNQAEIIGGGEISFIDLVDVIREFGVDPVVFVPGPGEVRKKLSEKGIAVVETPWPPIRLSTVVGLRRRQAQLAQRFKDLHLDLVHVNGARSMLYAGPAARQAGIPCVWHVRVLERDRILDRIRAHYATAIVANSRVVADCIAHGTGREAEVVYNGFRLDAIESARPVDLAREFGIAGGPVILAAGRFSRGKRFDDLMRAFAIAQAKVPEAFLVLVGKASPDEADHEEQLKALGRELNLKNLVFPGWREDVCSLMKASKMLVVPSSQAEAFGRVIVEAWAAGLPVIAVNAGGPAELIRHAVDGLLVKPGDIKALAAAIVMLLRDHALAARLVEEGRKRALEFGLNQHGRRIMELYRRIAL